MSALSRPVVTGPTRALNDALHDLHHRAGWPSLRTLAAGAGVSHTTVSKVFSAPALPNWGTLELLVEVMGGDADSFHRLWLEASVPEDGSAQVMSRIAGRRTELGVVRRHFETGTGLLLVAGEAGMGKTKLVSTAVDATDTLVAIGHCLPLATEVPLLPVADCLRSAFEADPTWFERALTGCAAYVRDSLAALVPELAPGPGTRSEDRQALFTAVTAFVRAVVTERPFALLVEDLHWADAGTLDLLEYMCSRPGPAPVVGTWRSGDEAVPAVAVEWSARLRRLATTKVLGLGPLSREETAEQLRLLAPIADDQVDQIHARSQGQPLFTEQLAAHASEGPELPDLLADLLDRRLDALDAGGWTVVRTLGVAGRPLPAPVLSAASGLAADDLIDPLRDLTARRLIRDSNGSVGLQHPLLAEAAQRRMVVGEDVVVHHALATALSAAAEPEPAEVAEHWRRADEPAQELAWRTLAADLAHERSEPATEAAHLLRCLELTPDTPSPHSDRTAIELAAFDALELSDQLNFGLVVARQAYETVDRTDDRAVAEVLRRLAWVELLVENDAASAFAHVTCAIELLSPYGASECLAHALDFRAGQLNDQGRPREALDDLRRALDVCAELRDDGLFFGTSTTLGGLLAQQGDLQAGLTVLRQARERVPQSAGPRREAYLAMMHTDMLLRHRRPPDELRAATQRAQQEWDKLDTDFLMLTIAHSNVAESLLDAGRTADAAAVLDDLPQSDFIDNGHGVTLAARLAIARGELSELLDVLHHASTYELSPAVALDRTVWSATANLWLGRPRDAWNQLYGPMESTLDHPIVVDCGPAFATLARCAADLAANPDGEATATAAQLATLRERAATDPLGPGPVPATRTAATTSWEAELARLEGRDRVAHWVRAADAWDAIRSPHDSAYCRWRAAQSALREGRGTVAARLLSRAAVDACEHAPLSQAISATRSQVHQQPR